jgi:hypothetical protein
MTNAQETTLPELPEPLKIIAIRDANIDSGWAQPDGDYYDDEQMHAMYQRGRADALAAQQAGDAVDSDALLGELESYAKDWCVRAGNADPVNKAIAEIKRLRRTRPAPADHDFGTWLWCQLMDWCKSQGVHPATQNKLFAIVGSARKRFPASVEQAAQGVPADGIERAARWVEARRDDFYQEHGRRCSETGAMEFGRGQQAELKEEYVAELTEIAEGIRALSASPAPAAEPVLDAPASVHRATFGVGVPWRTVIDAAKRHHAHNVESRCSEPTETQQSFAEALAGLSATAAPSVPEGKIVAWTRTDDILDVAGRPIGTDEPRVHWGSEHPDPSETWFPLYDGTPTNRWLPIETAPPGCGPGDHPNYVLVGHDENGYVFVGYRHEPNYPGDPEWCDEHGEFIEPQPTHWMPRPNGPIAAAPAPEVSP